MLSRWREYRRRQRQALYDSNHPHAGERREPGETGGPAPSWVPWNDGTGDDSGVAGGEPPPAPPEHEPEEEEHPDAPFGRAGRPLNRQSPFFVGFVGAAGVLAAIGLYNLLGRLSQVVVLLVVALFFALALDPAVEALRRRGLRRPASVSVVFAAVTVALVLVGLIVVPPVVDQGTLLVENMPGYVRHLLDQPLFHDLDAQWDLTDRAEEEFNKRLADGSFMSSVFGGVLGAGRALVGGFFSTFTVLVLTLYFLSTLPSIKNASYALVPRSRRRRVTKLSEEIMRRVGLYAIGQVAVATTNAVCSYVMMTILGIPYAAVLAVVVGVLGLIPMVGATLGAIIVAVVALFGEPRDAIIVVIYYIVYQQIENYVIAPRVMQRTVSVPGAVTVVAALIGGALAGVLGALLAIPVAAGLLLIYEEVLVPRQAKV